MASNYVKLISARVTCDQDKLSILTTKPPLEQQFWFFDDEHPEQVDDVFLRAKGARDRLTSGGHRVQVSVYRPVGVLQWPTIGEPTSLRQARAA